jgi:ring-1,2-phenylacetyl-CoA epoxidase subunit PaaA
MMNTAGGPEGDRYNRTLVQMMQGQAYRELAAARLFGHGLSFVPELRYLKLFVWHIREEMEHYEDVARMYATFTGESVEPIVQERLASRPVPLASSFYELAMAQFLYDRGGYFQLLEYEQCSYEPYARVVRKIVAEEKGHQALGERLVVELSRTGKYEAEKQDIFERWLRQGLLSFGRPGSEGARYSVSVGLRKRDPAAVMQDFLQDIVPGVHECGLTMPKLAAIGIDAPPRLDAVGA